MHRIEVVFSPFEDQLLTAQIPYFPGIKVLDALHATHWLQKYPDLLTHALGVYSRKVNLETELKIGDRLEVYRSLRVDPMEKRRQRAKNG